LVDYGADVQVPDAGKLFDCDLDDHACPFEGGRGRLEVMGPGSYGRRAERVVRKHRIIERMLTDFMGYTAAESHVHADELGDTFTDDMVDLILGERGSLKAEHGTGRIMSPYVRRQYGDELYAVMRELKSLFDPAGVLNPGTILDDDPQAHIRHIKTTPTVEVEVDRCVECGFCEPVCPSKDLTVTPRQRIVVRRAM
jgi:NAD-dependent dihydropyrimidine dehydrogenase PreA subunit